MPDQIVPILLGLVTGVLLRTAVVGLRLAAASQPGGRLSKRQLTVAACVAAVAGVLLVTTHGALGEEHPRTERTHHAADRAVPAAPAAVPLLRPAARRRGSQRRPRCRPH
ncbi:hypothetical protein ACFQX6_09765 [Streptosporangium lutulentum]